MNKTCILNYIKYLFCSAIILAICSKSSFLYPINNWGDANSYYIIGKGILHGLVPFRDLFEQKGPVIFLFMHWEHLYRRAALLASILLKFYALHLFAIFQSRHCRYLLTLLDMKLLFQSFYLPLFIARI